MPCVGSLVNGEDGNIVSETKVFRSGFVNYWKIRYALVDDLAADQRAVQMKLPENDELEDSPFGRVKQLHCR